MAPRGARRAAAWLLVGLAAACSPPGIAGRPPAPTATPAPHQVSGPSPIATCGGTGQLVGAVEEPSLAVDPRDPRHLVATWQQDRRRDGGAFGAAVAVSRDGGRTWRQQLLSGLTRCSGGRYPLASDGWASIGADGVAYVGSLGVGSTQAVVVSASRNGGDTWDDPVAAESVTDPSVILDKPSILADPRRPGVVYAVWARYRAPGGRPQDDEVDLARSADHGQTWSAPVRVYGAGTEAQMNQLLALADGSLADVFVEAGPTGGEESGGLPEGRPFTVRIARSRDDGATWSTPVSVARFAFTVTRDPERGSPIRSIGQDIAAAAGPSGWLYTAWFEDHRGGTSAIWVSASHDAGATWTKPSAVVQQAAQVLLPTLAVASDGTVGVLWYDLAGFQPSTGRLDTAVRISTSRDQGATWTTRHLDGPFDLRAAPASNLGPFIGDYEGLVGLPSGFGALYVKTQEAGGPTGVYFATAGR